MTPEKLAHVMLKILRGQQDDPNAFFAECARALGKEHSGTHYRFEEMALKIFEKRRSVPGRPRDAERKKKIAEAAIYARRHRPTIGKERAARKFAAQFGVTFSEVMSAAFGKPGPGIRAALRQVRQKEQNKKPTKYSSG